MTTPTPSQLNPHTVDKIATALAAKLGVDVETVRPFVEEAYNAGYAGRGSMPSHVQERGR